MNLILDDAREVYIKKSKKYLGGLIFSFSFTFNLPIVHTLKVVHLFSCRSITYIKKKKNVKGRFFLRDATQQPPLSLSLSHTHTIVERDDFSNCVNWCCFVLCFFFLSFFQTH